MRERTATRTFGTGRREAHNASDFYSRRLFSIPPKTLDLAVTNQVPLQALNKIFQHSSEEMDELPDNSIALMVTSPPYNVGKEYDQDLSLQEYLDFLKRVLTETYRVLVPGGRMAVNVANLGRRPYIPLNAYVASLAFDIGFLMRGEIIWVKAKGTAGSCAWGSWMSANNPSLRDLHEYILIFSKQRFERTQKGQSTISRDEFMAATTSVWHIPSESARRVGHPAPFPVALVERLIQLYTFDGETVLDPFMGSGSTAVGAAMCNRRFVGYEINPQYVAVTYTRVSKINGISLTQ